MAVPTITSSAPTMRMGTRGTSSGTLRPGHRPGQGLVVEPVTPDGGQEHAGVELQGGERADHADGPDRPEPRQRGVVRKLGRGLHGAARGSVPAPPAWPAWWTALAAPTRARAT